METNRKGLDSLTVSWVEYYKEYLGDKGKYESELNRLQTSLRPPFNQKVRQYTEKVRALKYLLTYSLPKAELKAWVLTRVSHTGGTFTREYFRVRGQSMGQWSTSLNQDNLAITEMSKQYVRRVAKLHYSTSEIITYNIKPE